jgi:hypothetical protein
VINTVTCITRAWGSTATPVFRGERTTATGGGAVTAQLSHAK